MLGYAAEKRLLRNYEIFKFRIFDSPQKVYQELALKEAEKPTSARLVAGFCWSWSQTRGPEGQLVKDAAIGKFAMPWETHDKITHLPKGYVKWYKWAYRRGGLKQVGCVYTAQGFEFDYVG